MPFPSYSEYIDQITTALDQYQHLQPVKKSNGDLYYSTGNFGVVIKMIDPKTQKYYAIKCFTREKTNLLKRYKEIANYIQANPSEYIIPIEFLEKELYIDSSITDENEFPALIMPWIEGIPLNNAIKEACENNDNNSLRQIFTQFLSMSIWLLKQDIAHTDLKPDNILYNDHNKSMVIVDYDGMYLPHFSKQAQAEGGTSGYIHPARVNQEFDRHLDDFSILIIALSLQMLILDSSLYKKYSNDTNLLFTQKDYNQLTNSEIYKEINNLKKDFPAVGVLGELLNYTLSSQTSEIAMLSNMLVELKKHSLVQKLPTLKELENWYDKLSDEWRRVLDDHNISKYNLLDILEIKKITSFPRTVFGYPFYKTEYSVDSLDGIYFAINLEELDVSRNKNLSDFSAIQNLKKLKKIVFYDCNLKTLKGLEDATELEELYLSWNENLTNFSALKHLKKLKHIDLRKCDLKTLKGLENAI
jgi:serine/threonine protein kinase